MNALSSPGAPNGMAAPTMAKMRATAQKFEAQALGSMLGNAFSTVTFGKGGFNGGEAEAQWRPMLVENYAKTWARQGGIGLADAVLREMVRLQGGGAAAGSQDGGAAASNQDGSAAGARPVNTSSTSKGAE